MNDGPPSLLAVDSQRQTYEENTLKWLQERCHHRRRRRGIDNRQPANARSLQHLVVIGTDYANQVGREKRGAKN